MELRKLVAATALAVSGGISGQAMAVLPGAFDAPEITIYISGSPAVQNQLGSLVGALFGANSTTSTFDNYHVYWDDTTTNGGNYRAYFGVIYGPYTIHTTTVGNVTIYGRRVLIINRTSSVPLGSFGVQWDSVLGVDPVATRDRSSPPNDNITNFIVRNYDLDLDGVIESPNNGSGRNEAAVNTCFHVDPGDGTSCDSPIPIATMGVSAGTCTAAAPGLAYEYNCAQAGGDGDPTNAGNRIPDIGVSDVEPELFKAPYNLAPQVSYPGYSSGYRSYGQLLDIELKSLSKRPVLAQLYGIPVTAGVPADVPFNRALVTGLYDGSITDWGEVVSSLAGNKTVVCRQLQGSGTQATANAYFNNFPCAANSLRPGVVAPARMSSSTYYTDNGLNGYIGSGVITVNYNGVNGPGNMIIENPSSGNVRSCLDAANSGGSYSFNYTRDDNTTAKVTVNFGGAQRHAVGVLSMDSTPSSNWGWRQLNGANGTKNTMRHGQYDYFSEVSMQYNKNGFSDLLNPRNWINSALTSTSAQLHKERRALVEFIIEWIGLPSYSGSTTAAIPSAIFTPSEAGDGLNTNYVTRQGNSCSPVTRLQFPASSFPAGMNDNP